MGCKEVIMTSVCTWLDILSPDGWPEISIVWGWSGQVSSAYALASSHSLTQVGATRKNHLRE
jgi:hypothetical protein